MPLRHLCVLLFLVYPLSAQPESKPPEKPKWDTANPPGPRTTANIDTDSGTWMNLDVSPDGKEIVFDLLGNIYLIPINGGEAKALTNGIPWDMQPRFSPDGKRISFTSDRAGGDNIWIMDRDGANPKQVTKEDFRLVNNAVWSPDSQFIAARKHFSSERSLGSGEIWLWHVAGGGGLQMTKKPNEEKDAGEPAFSQDGRFIYYSQDVTAGSKFEYNKDPNKQIYAIKRFDRETGETENWITGPGGAIRPTPSPDGKTLAYVHRVRSHSVLMVQDIASGQERELYDGLDHDLQETWAIHGVYANFAWTPDSKSLVFWSAGKLHRVDVNTKDVKDIPFHVKTTREITEAVRFPIEVAPAQFHTKMLRWPVVSPKGDVVVYQALGKLYTRSLPDGKPARLTKSTTDIENYPSWTPDGKSLLYVAWTDENLGTVRLLDVATGASRAITTHPGHYSEPVMSPDGKNIVYAANAGGGIVSRTWSHSPGIYVVPTDGGEPRRLTSGGEEPHFAQRSDRVFFNQRDDKKTHLKSIGLLREDPRTHITSEDATEMRVSPDGQWFAWKELFQAYIAPFPATGQPVTLGPKSTAVPQHRVTKDAGDHLRWSSDSSRLYWILGPELFSTPLNNAFAFLSGAPEKLPDAPEHGIDIGFDQPFDVPSGTLALVGARIVTMRGDEVIEKGTIVIDKNRIAAIGDSNQVKAPAGAKVINVTGKTIIPGLVDVHAHGPVDENNIVPERNWINYASMAFGVTTTHDPSNDTFTVFAASELQKAGMITAPRTFSTGTILYGAHLPIRAEINSLDDAFGHLRRLKAAGAFSVKSYNQPRRDQRQQIIAAARQLQMMVVPEGGSLYQHNMTMIADGHTGIEHAVPMSKVYGDVLQFWPQSHTWYTPTLIVGYGGIWGENYWYSHSNLWENERLLRYVPRLVVDPASRRRTLSPEDEYNHEQLARVAKQLYDAGVHIQLGAHGQMQGIGPHWELWSFVQGGMTPLQALRCGTLYGAQYLGLDKDIGSLEVGKLADLAVLDRNPLANIRDSEYVHYVMVNGRIYETDTMNEAGNHPHRRGKLFFEQ